MWKKLLWLGCIASSRLAAGDFARENPEKYWDFEKLKSPPAYRIATEAESQADDMQALYIKGYGPAKGDKTLGANYPKHMSEKVPAEFFAYYATPSTPAPKGGYPGIVLIHGGGGTAYPQFVKIWVAKGYAVIALDWYNQRPSVKNGVAAATRIALAGGKRQDHVSNVANMILCHSFLLAQKNVNPERTAFVGLSWGSWYGAMLASIDDRFKGGVEIYCGDVKKHNGFINGRFLHRAKIPLYWVVGTNDRNMTLESAAEAYKECPTTVTKSQVIRLPHSHVGFRFESCARMAAYFTGDGVCLPKLADLQFDGKVASAKLLFAGKGIKKAILCYTESNDKAAYKREWKSIIAEQKGDVIYADVPANAKQFYLSAYDDEGTYNDLCGSTPVFTRK